EPLHVEEQESPPGLPDPPLPRLDEGLLRHGDGLEDRVLQGAVPDDLITAGEDGLVRVREDDAHLPDLIDLHSTVPNPGRRISLTSGLTPRHSANSSSPIRGLISPATFAIRARATSLGSRVWPSTHMSLTRAVSGVMSSAPMAPAFSRSRPVS